MPVTEIDDLSRPKTDILARWISGSEILNSDAFIRNEVLRTFVNWMGCAIGGANHPLVVQTISVLGKFSNANCATIFGHPEKTDYFSAALINAFSSHIHDFDDTHTRTLLHPSAPVASAAMAIAESRGCSGVEVLGAITVGLEVACRTAKAICPSHYDRGWHVTGTAGAFGAAAAVSRLLNFDELRTRQALGIAATQASGIRQTFGTSSKSLNPGRAAQSGLVAALLLEAGADCTESPFEGPGNYLEMTSSDVNLFALTEGLGSHWELQQNALKRFPCGAVLHPLIHTCLYLGNQIKAPLREIERIRVEIDPYIIGLARWATPRTSAEAKLSINHVMAVALLDGKISTSAFSDEFIRRSEIDGIRNLITVVPNAKRESINLELVFRNGQRFQTNSAEVPAVSARLSDQDLADKFLDQVGQVLGNDRARDLLEALWNLPELPRASTISELSVPR